MAKGWFSGGDKHTGWKDANGKPVTDNQAKAIVDAQDKKYGTGKYQGRKGGK